MSREPEPRRVLLLGGSGFLGAHVARELDRRGFEVLAVARRPGERPARERERVRNVAADLAADGTLAPLVELLRPHAIVGLCALSRVGDCERDPALAERLNTELPAETARLAAGRELRLIHVSTDLVFGGEPPRASGYVEEDEPAPLHVYGSTKAGGERATLDAYSGALVVRLPLLFGDSFGRRAGASDSLLSALGEGEGPRLFTDEWRTPLDVAVAATALGELVRRDDHGLLHVAGSDRLTRLELGKLVVEAAGRPVEAERLVAATREELGLADRPADVSLDSARARALLATKLPGARESLAASRST